MKKILAIVLAVLMLTGCAFAEEASILSGGWTPAADPAVTEEIQALLAKGLDGLVGVNYTPVAYLGSQVVAGTNHAILCQATVVYPNAQPKWVIIYLYEDLSGNASLMNIADFDFGALCVYGAADHQFATFETADGTAYDLFVITRMNYGPDHKVTSVTGHYERVVMGEEWEVPEIAPDSEKTYQLAEDFTADMLENAYDDIALSPVTDLFTWYVSVYLAGDSYDGHDLVFTQDLPEAERELSEVDFWFVTTRIELNDQDEIQYMEYYYVPWA